MQFHNVLHALGGITLRINKGSHSSEIYQGKCFTTLVGVKVYHIVKGNIFLFVKMYV